MNNNQTILYSFRRCPYAIRARMALIHSAIRFTKIEVSLKDKPKEMLTLSHKGTVPVLHVMDRIVLDESIDIMCWALLQINSHWLPLNPIEKDTIDQLIALNDDKFKFHLDRFKYPDRYKSENIDINEHRVKVEEHLSYLNQRLQFNNHLVTDRQTIADIALFPFVRQVSRVDLDWFVNLKLERLNSWLNYHLKSELFIKAMVKT